jgi:hypothetical protein
MVRRLLCLVWVIFSTQTSIINICAVQRERHGPPMFHIVPSANIRDSPSRSSRHKPAISILVVTEEVCMNPTILTSRSAPSSCRPHTHLNSDHTVHSTQSCSTDCVCQKCGTGQLFGLPSTDDMLLSLWRRSP